MYAEVVYCFVERLRLYLSQIHDIRGRAGLYEFHRRN